MKQRLFAGVEVVLPCILAVLIIKAVVPNKGWAAYDSQTFHFVIINHFIKNGFSLDYPKIIPMFPGMHIYFAGLAEVIGSEELSFDGWLAFGFQAPWGILYIVFVYLIVSKISSENHKAPASTIALVVLCSPYALSSWLHPTTDLGAYTAYLGMMYILIRREAARNLSLEEVFLFSAFSLLATLFRQNYAVLSAALIIIYIIDVCVGRSRVSLLNFLKASTPILATGALVGYFFFQWGGLVPPELARHGGTGVSLSSFLHVIAYTGLMAWPFVLFTLKPNLSATRKTALVLASLIMAIVFTLLVDMSPNETAGRSGSLVWLMLRSTGPLDKFILCAMLCLGLIVWASVFLRCYTERDIPGEIILLTMLSSSIVIQPLAYQRYIEPAMLMSFCAFFFRRETLKPSGRWIFIVWFGVYGFASLIKTVFGFGGP